MLHLAAGVLDIQNKLHYCPHEADGDVVPEVAGPPHRLTSTVCDAAPQEPINPRAGGDNEHALTELENLGDSRNVEEIYIPAGKILGCEAMDLCSLSDLESGRDLAGRKCDDDTLSGSVSPGSQTSDLQRSYSSTSSCADFSPTEAREDLMLGEPPASQMLAAAPRLTYTTQNDALMSDSGISEHGTTESEYSDSLESDEENRRDASDTSRHADQHADEAAPVCESLDEYETDRLLSNDDNSTDLSWYDPLSNDFFISFTFANNDQSLVEFQPTKQGVGLFSRRSANRHRPLKQLKAHKRQTDKNEQTPTSYDPSSNDSYDTCQKILNGSSSPNQIEKRTGNLELYEKPEDFDRLTEDPVNALGTPPCQDDFYMQVMPLFPELGVTRKVMRIDYDFEMRDDLWGYSSTEPYFDALTGRRILSTIYEFEVSSDEETDTVSVAELCGASEEETSMSYDHRLNDIAEEEHDADDTGGGGEHDADDTGGEHDADDTGGGERDSDSFASEITANDKDFEGNLMAKEVGVEPECGSAHASTNPCVPGAPSGTASESDDGVTESGVPPRPSSDSDSAPTVMQAGRCASPAGQSASTAAAYLPNINTEDPSTVPDGQASTPHGGHASEHPNASSGADDASTHVETRGMGPHDASSTVDTSSTADTGLISAADSNLSVTLHPDHGVTSGTNTTGTADVDKRDAADAANSADSARITDTTKITRATNIDALSTGNTDISATGDTRITRGDTDVTSKDNTDITNMGSTDVTYKTDVVLDCDFPRIIESDIISTRDHYIIEAGDGDINAGDSDINEGDSDLNASEVDINAGESDINARESDINAGESDINAGESDINARDSDINAGESGINAGESGINASESGINAGESDINTGETDVYTDKTNIYADTFDSTSTSNTDITGVDDTDITGVDDTDITEASKTPVSILGNTEMSMSSKTDSTNAHDVSNAGVNDVTHTSGPVAPNPSNTDITSTGNTDITSISNADIASTGNVDIVSTGNADIASTGNADIASTGNADIASTGNADIVSTGNTDIASTGNADIASTGNADIASTGNADIASTGNADIASTGNADIASTGNADTSTADTMASTVDNGIMAARNTTNVNTAPRVENILAMFDSAVAGQETSQQFSEVMDVSSVSSNKFSVDEGLAVPSSVAVTDRSVLSHSPRRSMGLEAEDSESISRAVALREEDVVRVADVIIAAHAGTSVADTGDNQTDIDASIHCADSPSASQDVGSNASRNKADSTITKTAASRFTVTSPRDHLHADTSQLGSASGREGKRNDADMQILSPDRPGLGARSAPKSELTITNEGPHMPGEGRRCKDAICIKEPPRLQEGAFSKDLTTYCVDRRAGSSTAVPLSEQPPCAIENKSQENERTKSNKDATSALVVREDTDQTPQVHDKSNAAIHETVATHHICTTETNTSGITNQSLGGGGDSKNETVPPVCHNTQQTEAVSDLDVPPPKPKRLFLRRMSSERKLKLHNDSPISEEDGNADSSTPPKRPLRRKESLRQQNTMPRRSNKSVPPTNLDKEHEPLAAENEAGEHCGSSPVGVEARGARRRKQAGTVPRPYDSGNKWLLENSKHSGDARSGSGDAAAVTEVLARETRTIEVPDGVITPDSHTQDNAACLKTNRTIEGSADGETGGSEVLSEEVLLDFKISSGDSDQYHTEASACLDKHNSSPSIKKLTNHSLDSNRSPRVEKSKNLSKCEMTKAVQIKVTEGNSETICKKIQSNEDNIFIPSLQASKEMTNNVGDNSQVFNNSHQTEPDVKSLSERILTPENTECPRPPERRKKSPSKIPNGVCLERTTNAMDVKIPGVSKPMVPERTYRRYKSLPRQRKPKAAPSPTSPTRTPRKPVGRAASTATCRPQHSPSGLKFSSPEVTSLAHYDHPTAPRPAERASVMLLMEHLREHVPRTIDWSAITPRLRQRDRAASDGSIHNNVKRRISLKRTGSLKKLYSSIQRNFINNVRNSDVNDSVICLPRPKIFGRKQRRYDMKLSPDMPSEIPQLEPYSDSSSVDLVENLPDVYLFHSKLEFFEDKTYPSPVERKRFASESECRDEERLGEDVPPVPLRRHKRARNRTLVIEASEEHSENATGSQELLDKTADLSNGRKTSVPSEDIIVVHESCSVARQRFFASLEPGTQGETGNEELNTQRINHNTSQLCTNDITKPDNAQAPSARTKLNPDMPRGEKDFPEDRVPSPLAEAAGGDAGDNGDLDEALLALADALSHVTHSESDDVDSVGTCITHISEDVLHPSLSRGQTTSKNPESDSHDPDTTSTNIYNVSDTLNRWMHDPFCDTDEGLRAGDPSQDLMQFDKSGEDQSATAGSPGVETAVGPCWEPPAVSLQTWEERQGLPREEFPPLHLRKPHEDGIVAKLVGASRPTSKTDQDTPSPGPPADSEKEDGHHRHHHQQEEEKQKAEEDRAQQDRCVEVYPETVRQRQRNMMASSGKVDIKNWNSSSNNNNNESQMSPAKVKKFLPSVKALRNQFEAGKTNNRSESNGGVNSTGNGTLSHRSSGSTSSLASSTLEKTSSTNSLNSASDSMENLLSPSFENQRQVDPEEPVEPIFNQFKKVDEELKDLMSRPPSTTGWNPRPLLKRLYYTPEVPKIQSQGTTYINIEGFLEKLPSGRKKATFWNAWKRRYFVAKDGVLYYYQNTQAEKPSMKMTLMGGKVECMEPNMIGVDDGKGHYVVVRCSSRQEAERWRRALETHTVEDFASQYVQPWPMPTSPALLRDTLVIDLGSASVRAGVLASQATLPQVFLPSVVATERETRRQVWGFDALAPDVRAASSVSFPIRPSHKITKYSVDLSAISSLLQKTFADLKVDPKNYHIQLSVPRVLNNNTQTELLRVLFDKFGVRSVNLTHQSILALYAYNATSGIVVDIGERMDIVPVIDGYIVDGGVSRVPYGGYRILDHLRQFLYMRNVSLINEVESYIIRHVLENICYCAHHYNTEKARCTNNPDLYEKDVSLAEYFHTKDCPFETISLDFGRFQATEGLFNPDAWGLDHPGLHKLVHKAIMECSMDIRKEMSRSIFLAGGVTQLPGLVDRLTTEIDNLTPPAIRPKVHASPYRYHAAYIGACVLAESPAFVQSRISREDWNKHGNAALRKWSL